jgi:hypothetical protein
VACNLSRATEIITQVNFINIRCFNYCCAGVTHVTSYSTDNFYMKVDRQFTKALKRWDECILQGTELPC